MVAVSKKKNDAGRDWATIIAWAIAGLPWLWLAVFGAFLGIAILELGYVPHYANPDPKDLNNGGIFYVLTWLLLPLTFYLPLAWGAVSLLRISRIRWLPTAIMVVGYLSFWLVMAGPLGEWLMD